MKKDATTRFSHTVENYIRYRPGYPDEVINFMEEELDLKAEHRIADIGSGTGKLSILFLENGNRVYGIEPNRAMREAGEELMAAYPNFTSMDGTAEDTGLPEKSIDFVTAAQAFHWFDVAAFRKECRRILRPGGWTLLIWNDRIEAKSTFMQAYEDFLQNYSTDYQEIDLRRIEKMHFDAFFGPGNYSVKSFEHYQLFDFSGVRGRYLSCSYALTENQERYGEALDHLQGIVNDFGEEGKVKMWYQTKIYYGKR